MRKANVLKYLMNEAEKGNIYVDNQGNLLSYDDVIDLKTKLFVKALSEKRVSMDTTMDSFFSEAGFTITKISDVIIATQDCLGCRASKETIKQLNDMYGVKKEGEKDA